jgi:hypothetical protein
MSQLVFSINSGRSGSDYLYRLLSTAENAKAFHEPRPSMAGSRMSKVPASRPTLFDHAFYAVMYLKKYQKVKAIREVINQLSPEEVYVETNHMFILTFYDVIMNHFRDVHVVMLRRYLPWVVKSFLDLNMFTPEDSKTKYWTSSPNSPSAAVPALAPDDEMDQVDRCIGYVIDIEARAQRFMQQYPDATVIEKRLPELNSRDHVEDLFAQLKLRPTAETWQVCGHVYNDKSKEKETNFSEAFCRDRILKYVEACRAKGIELPELPHLDESYKSLAVSR